MQEHRNDFNTGQRSTSQIAKTSPIIGIITAAALFMAITALAQQFDTSGLQQVSRDQVPKFCTVWVLRSDGFAVPLPGLPLDDLNAPVYALSNGLFLLDASEVEDSPIAALGMDMALEYDSGGGGDPPPLIPNFQKFMGQVFSVINTNDAAVNDTNLYNVCVSFPDDGNTGPNLQIALHGLKAVVIKANHFDYSAETRDFALLVCDKVATPTWKNIDLSTSNSMDGWLIQGLVPNWKVTDPMYVMVTNMSQVYNCFFQGIPYSGPQINLTGAQPYDTVNGMIALTAAVTDLSGTTNQQYAVTVNGLPTRYSLDSGNSISIDTRYAPNGIEEVELAVGNQSALLSDPANPTPDTKTAYSTTAALPLDFENATYLVWPSDLCSPDVGTNYILFAVSTAQQIAATIKDPTSGETLASYGGYVPYPATVEIPWNFTKADGVTPYTNDTYSVTFVAYDPTTLAITNTIVRKSGVRPAGRCILTYEEEDPGLSDGAYLNSQASTWVGSLAYGYTSLYATDWGSLTGYSPSDIGANRDNSPSDGFPWVLTGSYQVPWFSQIYAALTNTAFSDFSWYMGHGNGTELGGHGVGSTFVTHYLPSDDVRQCVWVLSNSRNCMMRKVALWACYTDAATPPPNRWGDPIDTTGQGTYPSWQLAFGIRDTPRQNSSWVPKNVGLFFGGELPEGGYSGTLGGTCPELAVDLDDLWIEGAYPYPGGCDPTYAFSWVVTQIEGMSPEIMRAMPAWIGFGYLPFTGIYDGNLLTNDVSNIKR